MRFFAKEMSLQWPDCPNPSFSATLRFTSAERPSFPIKLSRVVQAMEAKDTVYILLCGFESRQSRHFYC